MHNSRTVVDSKRLFLSTDPSASQLMRFLIDNSLKRGNVHVHEITPPQSDDQSDSSSLEYSRNSKSSTSTADTFVEFVQCFICNERVPLCQLDTHWDEAHHSIHSSIVAASKRYFASADASDWKSMYSFQFDNGRTDGVNGHKNIQESQDVTPTPSASAEDLYLFNDDTSSYASETVISDLKIKVQNMNQSGSKSSNVRGTVVTESVKEVDFVAAETAMRPTMEVSDSLVEPHPSTVLVNGRSRLLVPMADAVHTSSFNVMLSEVFQELHGQYEEDEDPLESLTISRSDSKEERHWMEKYPAPLPSLRCIPRQNSVCNIDEVFDCQNTIGFGSSCTVIKAQDIGSGKLVALKQIPKGQRKGGGMTSEDLLSNERVMLDALEQHENVVRLFAVYETPGHFFLATELLTGNECESV